MANQDSVLTTVNYYLTIHKQESSTYDFKGKEVAVFDVYDFTGEEYLNDDFLYSIQIVSEYHINIADLLNIEAELYLQVNTKIRKIKGYVSGIKASLKVGKYFIYKIKLTSWLEYLKHVKYSRIYHKLSAKDIIKKAIAEVANQLDMDCNMAFALSNNNNYPIREHCVQYDETVYNFIFRLLEEEGMFLQIDQNTITIQDHNTVGDTTIKAIINEELSIASSNIQYNSYDYEHANHNFQANKKGMIYDNKEDKYAVDNTGVNNLLSTNIFIDRLDIFQKDNTLTKYLKQKADIATNRNIVLAKTMSGTTKDLDSYAGLTCIIQNTTDTSHPFEQKSMIISSKHTGTRHNSLQEYSPNETGGMFSSDFTFINDAIFYKPPLKRHKNRINSKQLAIIGTLGDQEHYIDDMGRVRVHFLWNEKLDSSKNESSLSCWVRLSQMWNGSQNGAMFIPSVGQEVLVTFVNGDPDYPIVDGMLYNSKNQAKNDWKETVNQWSITSKSSGKDTSNDHFSQIMFDSTNGKELIYLQSQKDFTSIIKNDETKTITKNHNILIGQDQTQKIAKNQNISIGTNQNITVNNDYSLDVKKTLNQKAKNSIENVSENKTISVAENLTTEVVKNSSLTVKGTHANVFQNVYTANFQLESTNYYKASNHTHIDKDNYMDIVGSSVYSIGKNLKINTKGTFKIQSEDNIQIESKSGISLHSGSNLITITKDSISIKGSKVQINSGGSVLKAKDVESKKIEEPKLSILRVTGLEITTNKKKRGRKPLTCKIKVERCTNGEWKEAKRLSAIEKTQITCEAYYKNPKTKIGSYLRTLPPVDAFKFKIPVLQEHIYQSLTIRSYVGFKKDGKKTTLTLERDLKIISVSTPKKNTYKAETNLESLTEKEKKSILWKVEYYETPTKKKDKQQATKKLVEKKLDPKYDILSHKLGKKHKIIAYEKTYKTHEALYQGESKKEKAIAIAKQNLPKATEKMTISFKKHLPKNNGVWEESNVQGEKTWKPTHDLKPNKPKPGCCKTWDELLGENKGILFVDSMPIFTAYAIAKVDIPKRDGEPYELTLKRYKNFAAADRLLLKQAIKDQTIEKAFKDIINGSKPLIKHAKELRTKCKLSWHECNIYGHLELVRLKIHGNIPHSGGISALKAQLAKDKLQ